MYAGGMPALPGMRGWPEGTCAWLSSGESTGLSPSTPFASPDAGSGAFRQAWSYVREDNGGQLISCLGRTWMRFFPSGLVTRGCNFGVVNVYTSPVSDTTSSKTWVPVRTESSYA